MNKVLNILFGLIIPWLFIFCRSNQVEKKRTSFNTCVIRIISPFGCYQQISLTNYGSGEFKQGLHDGNTMKDTVILLDSLYSVDSFKIEKENDLKKINTAISSMMSDTIKGNYKYDAYRFQVIINDQPHIDVYGNTIKINETLKVLVNYLPYAENYCEFFQLMKEKYPTKK